MDVQHIYLGATAPATAPAGVGHHYVDTVAKVPYLSVGTGSAGDWKALGAPIWGQITGTLSDQTDLQSALDAKVNLAGWGGDRLIRTDDAGNIIQSAIWFFQNPYEGLDYNNQITTSGGGNIINTYIGFQPTQNNPNDNYNALNMFMEFDSAASGFSQGTSGQAGCILSGYIKHVGTGNIGSIAALSTNFELGNGTDPIQVGGTSICYGFGVVRNGVTIVNQMQGYGFQPSMETGSVLLNGVTVFYDYANIENAHGYNLLSSGANIKKINNNSNYNAVSSFEHIIDLEGNAGYFWGVVSPTITNIGASGQFQGLSINPTIANANGRTVSGININFSNVSGTTDIQGVNVTGGRSQFQGKSFAIESDFESSTDQGGFGGGPLGLNNFGGTFHIESGNPITGGAFAILNNLGVSIVVEDNFPADSTGLGLGCFMNGFATQIGIRPGKTMDSLSFMAAGASVPPTYGGGTLNTVNMFRALGVINQGDSINIGEIRGFYVDPFLTNLSPSSAWGFRCDDPNADNHFEKSISIGTSTKKVTNGYVALEIGSKKQLVLAVMTTTERDAMTAVQGAIIFNSTTLALECFNGTSWV